MFRNRVTELVLHELGGCTTDFDHAPADTKRISNLLRSKKWKADLIDDFFFERTVKCVEELKEKDKRALMLWDNTIVE